MTDVSDQPTPAPAPATERRECKLHGPYDAKVVNILGRVLASSCPTCQAAQAAHEAERAQREQTDAERRRIEANFQRAGIPPRFQAKLFGNYEAADEQQQRAKRVAMAYAEAWADVRQRGTCLIFSGSPGTGKTHLACAIANAVISAGASALFTTVSDALRSIKRSYDRDADITEAQAIHALVEPALLILDEVGADLGTDHSKTLLFDIINKRYENIRPTIVLTNLDLPALREYLGDRIMDRMREGGGKAVVFNWASRRM